MIIPQNRVRLFQILAAAALLTVALANCGLAFIFPLELELREGSSWLHVLAERAGISLYDHSRVAFLNMNHGPLDPWFKHAISAVFPFLSASMVTRIFVLLLPLGLFLAMSSACAKKLTAVLWAGGLYLFLLGLQPPNFLIGRSDPAALFFLGLLLWISPVTLRNVAGSPPRALIGVIASGLLSAIVILTNWRLIPAVGAAIAGLTVEGMTAATAHRRWPSLFYYLGGITLVAGLAFAVVLVGIFHGNWTLYCQHFFGFFSNDSGWGAGREEAFHLFPSSLIATRWPIHLLALLGIAVGLISPSETLPRKIQFSVWLPLLGLLWIVSALALFLNHSGGGLYYFGSFYIVLAFHLARAMAWKPLDFPSLQAALSIGLLLLLPWVSTWQQVKRLLDSFGPATAFLAETQRLAAGRQVYSEEFYFFKNRYDGQMVDVGDVVFKVSATGYFGPELTATANRATARLLADPPPFIITGGIGSPVLKEFLARAYRPILRVPPDPASYAGPAQTLYQLRAIPAAPAGTPAN